METTSHPRLTLEQRRLLGGWRDVAEDVQRFAAALQGTPNGCGCGDGKAHLAGSCPCCQANDSSHEECVDCAALLHSLSWRVDALIEDTSRYMPAFGEVLAHIWPDDGEARVHDVQQRVARVAHAMTQLESAAHQFAGGCELERLDTLRSDAAELVAHVGELGDLLIPRATGPTRYNI